MKNIGSFILIATLVWFSSLNGATSVHGEEIKEGENLGFTPLEIQVILERMYLDGESSQEAIKETIWSMEDFWAKYDQWELINMEVDRVVFREYVDDISPLLKANGYFGISNDGTLTIFNGKPHTSKIIHTFFQLDMGRLESKKQEELIEGIPIVNKDRYVEVLETFKQYTLEESQAN